MHTRLHIYRGIFSSISKNKYLLSDNVVVAAGVVVTKDIPDGCLYGGFATRKISDIQNMLKKGIVKF